MIKLSYAVSKVIVDEYGQHEFLRRLADPLWFQAFGPLISIPGVGPATVRALSLIGEIIFGAGASWQDPVKYNFAHGGKDGVPYPVSRKTYDKSIGYLYSAIEGAEIERELRIQTLRKLAKYSARLFNQVES
jgi:hypothetical protein